MLRLGLGGGGVCGGWERGCEGPEGEDGYQEVELNSSILEARRGWSAEEETLWRLAMGM